MIIVHCLLYSQCTTFTCYFSYLVLDVPAPMILVQLCVCDINLKFSHFVFYTSNFFSNMEVTGKSMMGYVKKRLEMKTTFNCELPLKLWNIHVSTYSFQIFLMSLKTLEKSKFNAMKTWSKDISWQGWQNWNHHQMEDSEWWFR